MAPDYLYEQLLELITQPMSIADMLDHFKDDRVDRYDIGNRLKKGVKARDIIKVDPGTLYRIRSSSAAKTPDEVYRGLCFMLWHKYDEAHESDKGVEVKDIIEAAQVVIRLLNVKFDLNLSLDGAAVPSTKPKTSGAREYEKMPKVPKGFYREYNPGSGTWFLLHLETEVDEAVERFIDFHKTHFNNELSLEEVNEYRHKLLEMERDYGRND